mgnify:CR=1 FL=1
MSNLSIINFTSVQISNLILNQECRDHIERPFRYPSLTIFSLNQLLTYPTKIMTVSIWMKLDVMETRTDSEDPTWISSPSREK